MKHNFRLSISYDGTRYLGWEHQPNTDMTIQGKIENVLKLMTGELPDIICAGRTDAGVHAKAMIANVFLDTEMTEKEMLTYMNKYLPDDICVNSVSICSDRFHARYNATGKTYTYACYMGELKPVFDRKYVYTLPKKPDVSLMKEASKYLIGKHDFSAFCSNPRMKKSTVRTVDSISFEEKGDYLYITFHGNGFLQHMVRILTGTLLEVGFKNMTPEDVLNILNSRDRKLAGPTAPAEGLTMVSVDYS